MSAPGIHLVAGGTERAHRRLEVVDDHRDVSAVPGGAGNEQQVDLRTRPLEPHGTTGDSVGNGDLGETEEAVEIQARLRLGGSDLASNVLDHRLGVPEIAVIWSSLASRGLLHLATMAVGCGRRVAENVCPPC